MSSTFHLLPKLSDPLCHLRAYKKTGSRGKEGEIGKGGEKRRGGERRRGGEGRGGERRRGKEENRESVFPGNTEQFGEGGKLQTVSHYSQGSHHKRRSAHQLQVVDQQGRMVWPTPLASCHPSTSSLHNT